MPEDCGICLDPLDDGLAVQLRPCLHHFHSRCIFTWNLASPTCPLCRGPAARIGDDLPALLEGFLEQQAALMALDRAQDLQVQEALNRRRRDEDRLRVRRRDDADRLRRWRTSKRRVCAILKGYALVKKSARSPADRGFVRALDSRARALEELRDDLRVKISGA
jgi:hypothetical protein